jgi:hypothetical protein
MAPHCLAENRLLAESASAAQEHSTPDEASIQLAVIGE